MDCMMDSKEQVSGNHVKIHTDTDGKDVVWIWEDDLFRMFVDGVEWFKSHKASEEIKRLTCKWKFESNDYYYQTACGMAWSFTEGNIDDNTCDYCPKCGGRISIIGDEDE